MPLAACFDELPPRVSYLLSIITRLVGHLVGHLVFHLGEHLVVIVLSPMCFSCVVSSRSGVSSSRLVMRLERRRFGVFMCLLDLLPMAFSSRSYRLVGRDGERGVLMRLRNLFRGIFMNWE